MVQWLPVQEVNKLKVRGFSGGTLAAWGIVISGLLVTIPGVFAGDSPLTHDAKTCYAYGSNKLGNKYCTKRIKSRAKRNYTNNGTVIYSYTEITEWNDDLVKAVEAGADVDLMGNVEAKQGIREVHNVVEVKTDVDSKLDDLKLGTVDLKSRARTINNSVSIDGAIKATGAGVLQIGTVNIDNGSAQSVQSSITAGKIDASKQRVTIGGVKVRNARNIKKVRSTVKVQGGINAK